MESTEIARQRLITLVTNREPSDVTFDAKFGLPPRTFCQWKLGRGSGFMKILPQIAKEYGVTTDWLLGIDGGDYTPDTVDVPIIGSIRAGFPIESYEVQNGKVKLPMDMQLAGNLFALDVRGDSMAPFIMDGDVIICTKNIPRSVNGKICVITIDNESTLKRVQKGDNDAVDLVPLNPMYPVLHYTASDMKSLTFTIDGILVQSIRKFNNF